MRIAVITVSDRASSGVYPDRSGPAILEIMQAAFPLAEFETEIVSDGKEILLSALRRHPLSDWILCCGGTGPAPRDQSPEAVQEYCDRDLPGISEFLRARSLEQTPNAVFSRGYSGMHGTQFVVSLPGSEKAARFCAELLAPLMEHGLKMSRGQGH